MNKNVLNLSESKDGNKIKQGDHSILHYELSDSNNDNLQINDNNAVIYLTNKGRIAYKYETKVKDNKVQLIIKDILPEGLYNLEVVVNDKYVFPSDTSSKIQITPSILGMYSEEINVPEITDEYILNVVKKDYAKSIGELDFLWMNIKNEWNETAYIPIIISKKSFELSGWDSYEEWHENFKQKFTDFAKEYKVYSQKEIFAKAKEMNHPLIDGFQQEFPIFVSVENIAFEYTTKLNYSSQHLFENSFFENQDFEIKVYLSYNSSPLEFTEISYRHENK